MGAQAGGSVGTGKVGGGLGVVGPSRVGTGGGGVVVGEGDVT
jgi:hypothetical protein